MTRTPTATDASRPGFRPPRHPHADCPLCREAGGVPVWSDETLRVIRADDAAFPAFYRVVWREHVTEFSDLSPADRAACMEAVVRVEAALRRALRPTKVNLAQFGNVVPHLHWHVIARFDWDSHFPQPVWAEPLRPVDPPPAHRLPMALHALDDRVRDAFAQAGDPPARPAHTA